MYVGCRTGQWTCVFMHVGALSKRSSRSKGKQQETDFQHPIFHQTFHRCVVHQHSSYSTKLSQKSYAVQVQHPSHPFSIKPTYPNTHARIQALILLFTVRVYQWKICTCVCVCLPPTCIYRWNHMMVMVYDVYVPCNARQQRRYPRTTRRHSRAQALCMSMGVIASTSHALNSKKTPLYTNGLLKLIHITSVSFIQAAFI